MTTRAARLGAGVLAVMLGGGCKSADHANEPSGLQDGETDVKPLKPNAAPESGEDISRVPINLWSPAQRQATASYYYLVAEAVALKERDAKKSLQMLEAAYGLDPNPFLGGKMVAAKAVAGDRSEALLDARKMVLLYPREPRLRFFYGDMLAQSRDSTGAIEQLEKCVELDPRHEPAYLELTELYQSSKQPGKALAVVKELVKNVPGSVAGWSQMSRLYLVDGQYKEALVPARRAWEMQSTNPQLTQIYAVTLQLNGKVRQAVQIYEQLYHLDPTDEELMGRMVELYRELGNLQSAIDLLDAIIKQAGVTTKPAVQMQKAILLWELKRDGEAVALLDGLVQQFPDSDRVRYLAAFGHERMEHRDKALELYRGIPASSSLKREADLRQVLLLKDKKAYSEALTVGERLLHEQNAGWEAWGLVAGVYADALRFEDSIRTADEGYKKFPDKPRLLFLRGVYQEKAGDRDGCIATMRQVIKVDPENSSAYNFLGYLFAEKGERLEEAESLVRRALALKPNDGFYLDSLGWVLFQMGKYDKALPVLEDASRREPKEGVIYEHLGDVNKAKGDLKGAQKFYEKALQENLEDRDRGRIEKKAKEGTPAGAGGVKP